MEPGEGIRGDVWPELSRRDFLGRVGALGAGALVLSAVPAAERLLRAEPAAAAVPPDGAVLQAFADTIIPGRNASFTDLGDVIDPKAIAGVDPEPGAVEADALRIFNNRLLGFPTLAPAFLADLSARALPRGGLFLDLGYDQRAAVTLDGLSFDNPDRVIYEAAAALPFVAFCAAASQRNATWATASGLRVMGHPGAAPNGYQRGFSYRRKLANGRTKRGSLA